MPEIELKSSPFIQVLKQLPVNTTELESRSVVERKIINQLKDIVGTTSRKVQQPSNASKTVSNQISVSNRSNSTLPFSQYDANTNDVKGTIKMKKVFKLPNTNKTVPHITDRPSNSDKQTAETSTISEVKDRTSTFADHDLSNLIADDDDWDMDLDMLPPSPTMVSSSFRNTQTESFCLGVDLSEESQQSEIIDQCPLCQLQFSVR